MSNSTTESTSTDTTADQCNTLNKNDEHLTPTFAVSLDPSAEELRLLRLARIADLEHPKDMAKAEADINQLKDKIATNHLKKEKLEGEVNSIKHNIKLAEELLRARIAKLECAKDIAQLEEEVNGIKGQQKATGPSLPPPNQWNRAACHAGLTLLVSNRLIVQRNGSHCEEVLPNPFITISRAKSSSVFAEVPISRNQLDIFYYELTILERKGTIHFGLATRQMPLDVRVGQFEGSYAYEEDGTFWGHPVERCRRTDNGIPFITDGIPAFCAGDIVGCGLKIATRQIFYTKNGQRLDCAGLLATSLDLFPCVTLCRPGDKIEANFGPNFIFNMADVF